MARTLSILLVTFVTAAMVAGPVSAVPINPGTPDYSWTFDDGSGATATAFSGGIDGTLETGAAFSTQATPVAGSSNGVVSLDGSTGNVNFGTDSAFQFVSSTFTLAFWVNTPATAARTMLLSKADGASTFGNDPDSWAYQMELLMTSSSLAAAPLTSSNNARFESETLSSNIDDGTWHHVAAVLETSTATGEVQIFVDGVERSTSILQNNFADNGAYTGAPSVPLRLGVRTDGGGVQLPMAGFFDEFVIYNRGLAAGEIEWLATHSIDPFVPEPSSLTLFTGALVVLRLSRKRRRPAAK